MKFAERGLELYHCVNYCKRDCSSRCPRSANGEHNNVCRGKLLADIQDFLDELIDYCEEKDI